MTATEIERLLHNAPREARVALAARLIAESWLDEDLSIDEPMPQLCADRDQLVAHLSEKIERR